MVQAAKHAATPIVKQGIKNADAGLDMVVKARRASGIPLRKRDAMPRDRNGNKFVKTIPYDLDRRYDEAAFNVYERRVRLGYKIPRAGLGDVDECLDNNFTGTALGFAYGLQYDRNQKGQCFENLETAIEALDTIMSMIFLIFLPMNWADLGLAINDFVDIVSSLYAMCQVQDLLATFATIMTFEGFSGLLSRTALGAQAELPYYLTKADNTDQNCIFGEMWGKFFQMVLDYSI
tara:strand:- start:47 stop:748 length:702 start_codon:yes stop_codon:yes gene_type:complete